MSHNPDKKPLGQRASDIMECCLYAQKMLNEAEQYYAKMRIAADKAGAAMAEAGLSSIRIDTVLEALDMEIDNDIDEALADDYMQCAKLMENIAEEDY